MGDVKISLPMSIFEGDGLRLLLEELGFDADGATFTLAIKWENGAYSANVFVQVGDELFDVTDAIPGVTIN